MNSQKNRTPGNFGPNYYIPPKVQTLVYSGGQRIYTKHAAHRVISMLNGNSIACFFTLQLGIPANRLNDYKIKHDAQRTVIHYKRHHKKNK